jgi:hypothetical protein
VEVTLLDFLILLIASAAIKVRQDLYVKHGVFMPAEAFTTVELCDQLLVEAGFHPDII